MTAYRALEARFERLGTVEDVIGLLNWDAQAMMPVGAAEGRASQLAILKGIAHELLTAAETRDLIEEAEADAGALTDWERANLREMRRTFVHAAAVPADLVEANSRATSRAEMVWREARRDSNYARLQPHLAEVLRLQRLIGEAKGEALGLSPYDALLDGYDPGLRQAAIDPLFADLEAHLPEMIESARERQGALPPIRPLTGPFDLTAQRRLSEMLMQRLGFDFACGRLDVSLHPFCGGSTGDVRITTRYDDSDFSGALMAVLHETGHALYEQGRPRPWRHQPVGRARGMSLHESQALLIEMQMARSPEFLAYLAPLAREAFGGEGPAWHADNLHRIYTHVEPGFIRVDADEVTYPAHIILRYELETAMVKGELAVDDLPPAFNERMRHLLGLTVPNDRLGCLQDIHWAVGAFGYFPVYTLGAMMAAQLFEAACRSEPGLRTGLAEGDFAPLVAWLRANVHERGSLVETGELLTAATGRPLDAGCFRAHLRRRYIARQ
jgi:carboxypeptidase Taq